MNQFHFANPEAFLLLPFLGLAFYLLKLTKKNAHNRLLKLLNAENLRRLVTEKQGISARSKAGLFWLGLALLVVAAARPQANPTEEELQSAGLDIYLLLDVSKSMDAEDIPPSRLKKAKRTIQHLTAKLAGDRVGIIAFANSATVICPLTNDYSIIDSYLPSIDTSIIPSQGTNFGRAFAVAEEAMERGAAQSQSGKTTNVFLLLSDGEDHEAADLSAIDAIRAKGGVVFTIAFGTAKGVPIPVRDEHGELRGYKKDRQGNTVVTAVEPETLKEIAQRGGGQFYFSTLDETEVDDMLARLDNMQRSSFTSAKTQVWEEWFAPVLALSFCLLFFSFIPLRALFRKAKPLAKKAAVLLLLGLAGGEAQASPLAFFWNQDREASRKSQELAKTGKPGEAAEALKELQAENPDNPALNYDMGTYFLLDKKGASGRAQLDRLQAAGNPLRDPALFNSGGSYALEGKKDEARAAYAELIQRISGKEKPTEADQKLLALTRQNLARLADPNQSPKPDNKQQQENQKGGEDQKQDKNQDQKNGQQPQGGQGQGGEQKKPDDKSPGDQPKQPGQEKKDDKGQGDQKQDDKGQSGKDQPDKDKEGGQAEQPKLPPRHGGAPFRERDTMGADEAKRILGALKERESDLQKKFLKNNAKRGKVNDDDAAKDW